MRSTVAGLAGIVVFAVLQTLAKTLFRDTIEAHGSGRHILAAVVIGGTFATYLIVYLGFSRLKRHTRKVRRSKAAPRSLGNRGWGASNLRTELVTLFDTPPMKRSWRKYLPLWGGAVALGLVIGAGLAMLPSKATAPGNNKATMAMQTGMGENSKARARNLAVQAAPDTEDFTPASVPATFGFCHTGGGANCVVDGDTIWIGGQDVRIADIDAPETHDYRCAEEKELGERATQRLIQLVNSGSVTVQPINRDEDRYGRKLRIVLVDGTSVGDTLVGEGLARYYEGGKRPWC
jgi:endonuclease YncB( thermonuclease family)